MESGAKVSWCTAGCGLASAVLSHINNYSVKKRARDLARAGSGRSCTDFRRDFGPGNVPAFSYGVEAARLDYLGTSRFLIHGYHAPLVLARIGATECALRYIPQAEAVIGKSNYCAHGYQQRKFYRPLVLVSDRNYTRRNLRPSAAQIKRAGLSPPFIVSRTLILSSAPARPSASTDIHSPYLC